MDLIDGPPAPKRIREPPFSLNFKFSLYKHPRGKVCNKIYREFYFDGITLSSVIVTD